MRGARVTTADSLAEKLEVSPRTIYRDIVDLQGAGVPVEGEAGVGYLMRDGYDIPPLMFTSEEVVALVAGARLTQAWGGAAMALAAEEALVKIEAVLPQTMRARAEAVHIHALTPGENDPATRALIDQLEAACQSRTRLELDYSDVEDTKTNRLVRPLALLFWGRVWTLVAWCELRDDFRMFRVDRIRAADERDRFRPEPAKSLATFYKLQACEGE